jgi:hypothetical protein
VQPQQLVLHLLARRALRRQLHLRGRQRRAHNSQLRSSLERWGITASRLHQPKASNAWRKASKQSGGSCKSETCSRVGSNETRLVALCRCSCPACTA